MVVTHSVPEGWPREGDAVRVRHDGIESCDRPGEGDRRRQGGRCQRRHHRRARASRLGLLDEIWVDLAPVLLGSGTPFFGQLANAPVELEGPEIVEGKDVTHLRFTVVRHCCRSPRLIDSNMRSTGELQGIFDDLDGVVGRLSEVDIAGLADRAKLDALKDLQPLVWAVQAQVSRLVGVGARDRRGRARTVICRRRRG